MMDRISELYLSDSHRISCYLTSPSVCIYLLLFVKAAREVLWNVGCIQLLGALRYCIHHTSRFVLKIHSFLTSFSNSVVLNCSLKQSIPHGALVFEIKFRIHKLQPENLKENSIKFV